MRSPLVELSPGYALLRLPTIGRFLVSPSPPVLVDRFPGATNGDIECFAAGPARALAALLVGQFALRAAVVAVGGKGVVLAGPSGAGKSALAAALAERGHSVLADGVGLVDHEGPTVVATSDEVQLWPDVALALGLGAGRVGRPALPRRSHRFASAAGAPLGAVIVLAVDGHLPPGEAGIEEAHGFGKVHALIPYLWHPHLISSLGRSERLFAWQSAIAAACPVFHLRRPRERPGLALARCADAVEASLVC